MKKSTLILWMVLLFFGPMAGGNDTWSRSKDIPSVSLKAKMGWQYRWGDSPRGEGEQFTWLQREDKGWNDFHFDQSSSLFNRFLWLRVELPELPWKDPSIYLPVVYHNLEVYVDGKLLYTYGRLDHSDDYKFEGFRWHIIPLPKDSEKKYVYFRIYSDLNKIGIFENIILGSQSNHILSMIRLDLDRVILACLFIFIGFFQLVMFLSKREQKAYLSFGWFAICMGSYSFCWTQIKELFFPNPILWSHLELGSLYLLPVFFCLFFTHIFGPGYRKIILRLGQIHMLYVTVVFPLSAFGLIPLRSTLFPFQFFLLLDIGFVLFTVVRKANKGDNEAKIFAAGFTFLAAFGIYDVLSSIGIIFGSYSLSHWGMAIFLLSLGFILEKRFLVIHKLLKAYSEELEEKNNNLLRIQQRLQKTNTSYSRFVPWEFLDYLGEESIIDVELGDQVQLEMTTLFSDIRSFTTLSESMTPKENFDFINSYLSRVGPIIRQNHGFIDKYIGDAIMALFAESPENALRTAIEMHLEVKEYNKCRQSIGYLPIDIGVGLHTGWMMLGTVGEKKRMEGTVISDAVNLASRLEGLTKLYGARIIISEETLNKLPEKDLYPHRFLGQVKVKGKKTSVAIFEVYASDDREKLEAKEKSKALFEEGVQLYHQKNIDSAYKIFQEIHQNFSSDGAIILYLSRCQILQKHGIPEEWDGVEAFDIK